jgi:hypothetical protein
MAGDAECAIGAPSRPVRTRRPESGVWVADFNIVTFGVGLSGETSYRRQRQDIAPVI